MTSPITGPHVAVVTPFDSQGTLDEAALRAQVRRQLSNGNKIFCNGTNGEFFVLSDYEKRRVTEICLDEAKDSSLVVTHIGETNLAQTIQHGKDVAAMGIKAVSVITPWFSALRPQELVRYFQQVADAVPVPVYLYNIPARTGNTITPEIAAELAKHPNIYGIKDSAGSLESLQGFLAVSEEAENFDVLTGPDSLILTGYNLGAVGCISGIANIVPELVNQVYQGFVQDDQELANQAQEKINHLRATLYPIAFAPAVVKKTMNLLGEKVGESRYPVYFTQEDTDKILSIVKA
ncbi:dihydrodipicolinate synthase family protein [Vibrio natriegens]|jgi:4-hydroxy-tetrahydrodipicolinate synthase|uniref:dihydrodipicolinate synthase family protein n=1 Tax=Vibrio TaxID=662 RepID=UPI0008046951|nr:dihydrodipicolinate synthase family protein [Vibrio natriegens]ANQ28724.1 dihydrodipicolinate synthase family protein [Vibrio natriegens]MCG9701705.1 dihydrodipicolinate synthase family protein [Vibrio natriegens]MCY9876491.1 dihydrodipicolinate synthase family protein [Vibrio natriegens]MEE3877218.1 dihydrodipicolinate synthase family protein [Vibrio sp. YYF0003]